MLNPKAPNKIVELKTQQSQEAEQAILALAFRDPAIMLDSLKDDDFFLVDHTLISKAIRDLHERGIACDPVTVANQVTQDSGKDIFDYLSDLYALTPPVEHADSYIRVVADHAYSRRVSSFSVRVKNLGAENLAPQDKRQMIDSLLDELDDSMPQISVTKTLAEGARDMAELVEKLGDTDSPSIMTGYEEVDDIMNGMMPGDLIILAGRPAMGKTALALNIAENVAMHNDGAIVVFSMEMSASQLSGRMACGLANIDSAKLRRGELTSNDWVKYAEAVSKMEKMNIIIDDRPGLSVSEMRVTLRRLKRAGQKIALVIIDYLQLMTGEGDKRHEQVTNISRDLKGLAKAEQFPVIALSQLSREVEKRADKRPTNSDLRESGAIEQDADVIAFIYRDEVYYPDSPNKGLAEVIISKHRAGAPGVALLAFDGKHTRFRANVDIYAEPRYVEFD